MDDEMTQAMQEAERRWERLTIADDFVFCKAMLNPELCRRVLEVILGQPIERIEYVNRQQVLDGGPDDKGVRLDVYVRDGRGTTYNVEMQAADTHELPQRARYYQAMMTCDQMARGRTYRALGDSYVIFVCGFDLFGLGRRVYSFEARCCEEESLALGDGSHIIFLAASAPQRDEPDRLDELLDYVADGQVAGELSALLDAEVARVLGNREWRTSYMWQEVRDQLKYDAGHEEGLAAGLAEGREEGAHAERDRFARLVAALTADGRTDELVRLSDAKACESLYREYGLA